MRIRHRPLLTPEGVEYVQIIVRKRGGLMPGMVRPTPRRALAPAA